MMGHEVKQHMLILRAYPDEWASDWSEELKIEAAQDVIAPLAPSGFALASVAEGIELTWVNPTLNYDGTPCNDLAWVAVYRKADSGGIDPDNPGSYDKRTLIQGESYTFPSTASGTTFYFLLTALDRTGNESEVTSELDEEPGAAVSADTDIPDDASGLIFKDAIGGDGVVSGHGILGIAFNNPADAWVHFDRYRLWFQYSTDGSIWRDEDGVADQWTEITPVERRGYMHKGLDATGTKAYRYKATVYARDGTESSTADTAGGAATTADGANNNDLLAISIFAMNIVCLGEVTANDISCTNLAAINADLGAVTAGSININDVFTVSAAGAVVASDISCTNLSVGAGSTWEGDALGTAYIPNLDCDKITSGTFGTVRIPDLSAAKITTGTLSTITLDFATLSRSALSVLNSELAGSISSDKIASINADVITTGTLDAGVVNIVNLTVTGVITCQAGSSYVGSAIGTAYTAAKCTDALADQTSTHTAADTAKVQGSTIIVGGYIATSFITASNIQAGTLNASLITVTNLSATSLTAGTLDFGAISRSALSVLNSELAGSITSAKIVSLAAEKISAGTITGSIIRTAASGARICMAPSDGGYTHVLNVYDATGIRANLYSGTLILLNTSHNAIALLAEDGSHHGFLRLSLSSGATRLTLHGDTTPDIVSALGLSLITAAGHNIILDAGNDIVLDVVDAAAPMYIHDWWATGGATGTAAGRILLTVDGNTRYLRLYT